MENTTIATPSQGVKFAPYLLRKYKKVRSPHGRSLHSAASQPRLKPSQKKQPSLKREATFSFSAKITSTCNILKTADLVSSHRPGLRSAGLECTWLGTICCPSVCWRSSRLSKKDLDLWHLWLTVLCGLSGLCIRPFPQAGTSLQSSALQEVAIRPSEMTFYMKLVDIQVLKTME